MTITTNYQLNLLEDADPVAVQPLNENFQKLDESIKEIATKHVKYFSGECTLTQENAIGDSIPLTINFTGSKNIIEYFIRITYDYSVYQYDSNRDDYRWFSYKGSSNKKILFPDDMAYGNLTPISGCKTATINSSGIYFEFVRESDTVKVNSFKVEWKVLAVT